MTPTALGKRARMLGDIDVSQCLGIEIGALHAPMVQRSEGRVLYADYASTESLRANLRPPGVDPADVVDVDIVWDERRLCEAIPQPVDYILASHVAEHVPDLIGWPSELQATIKPAGVVGLAIPDRRYTFDSYRQELRHPLIFVS